MKKFLAAVLAGLCAAAIVIRSGAVPALFSARYVPHRFCYLASPGLVWTNTISDGLIGASYAIIFAGLFWVAFRLRQVTAIRSYLWIFFSFGTFIVACGATHIMEIVTVWVPVYPLSATVKVICAVASVPTAILFTITAPRLAESIRQFLKVLLTTQREREQALTTLVASEKLAVAGRLTAAISHEIRNPLETAANLNYLAATDPRLPADLAAILQTARAELERANGIAGNMLSLFRPDPSPNPSDVYLEELASTVLELQRTDLAMRGIQLHTRLRRGMPIQGYAADIRQILINLVQNAAAALGHGGTVYVRTQPRHLHMSGDTSRSTRTGSSRSMAGYSITIADTGPGIAPSHRSRLFTLFFTTKGPEGTGVGLWLVRSMVERHGGCILVRSRTAGESHLHGTVFNIWIPFSPVERETLAKPEPMIAEAVRAS
ncbi:sensor histidine kinase [Silvibacterium dinghuense]|uniref:sensor histidine kinase n=1 Tax=Silvibacterium dinghuense TaxID=1560006 RepID=UPI0013E923DF|nr:HAMP domain-containing sensor histidine kinase [Silvibacterium dinghuense]